MDCLRFLVRLTSDLGLKEAQDYAVLLKKAEKVNENKRQVCLPFHSIFIYMYMYVHSQMHPLTHLYV